MLAGLPKAPSTFNPVANPKRAEQRRLYVLRRMHELGFLSDAQYEAARSDKPQIRQGSSGPVLHADYVAEMARQIAYEQFKEDTYTRGLRVITTIRRDDQEAAYAALRRDVMEYDRRHGFRGAEAFVDLSRIDTASEEDLEDILAEHPDAGNLQAALVLGADKKSVRAYMRGGETIKISGDGLRPALKMIEDKAPANRRIRRGAIIRVILDGKNGPQIAQVPQVEAAFVAADPKDGSIRALVGGFDFSRNQFNHVTQAWRQPGSSFKPFIYSAALEKGFSPSSVVEDSPLSVSSGETGGQAWEPQNYDGRYDGPISMRTALAKSKNMVSIRLLRSIGTRFAQDYVTRFGFDAKKHPPYLTMALGAGSVTPWQMVTAYSVFANGGYRVRPYIVKEIRDDAGNTLAEPSVDKAGDENLRAIDARNAYLMDSMMRDVVRRGTATRALALKRNDLAGKTGTTNEYVDAWFCGYQRTLVGIAWIGFDQPKRLGEGETGGAAALPMWIDFMQHALNGVPESVMEVPKGVVPVVITSSSADRPPTKDFAFDENASSVLNELAPVDSDTEASEAKIPHPAAPPQPPSQGPRPALGRPTQAPAPVEERSFR